nr:elongator complex protein 2 [Hymenolepis microstoma]
MESTLPSREFFVLRYPGIVNNHERAIETLGGLQALNKTFNSITRRLRLSFRPEMLFAKPVYGDHRSTTSLIIRAKQLRNKRTGEIKLVAEVVGTATRLYCFNGMIDFQYGPFQKVSASTSGQTSSESNPSQDYFQVFYDQLLVKEPSRVLDSYLATPNMPLFLPPLLFTRLDQPTIYCFSSRFRMNQYVELEQNSQQHPYHRKERKSFAIFVNFGDPIPEAAHPGALLAVTSQGNQTRKLARDVEKLFHHRPIWSKAALVHSLKWKRIREFAIKTILPAYAYYVPNGPWGRVWVRFGYDPCKHSSSRVYQTVDYRVRLPRLQAMLCLSGRRPRADDREDAELSGSDLEELGESTTLDVSLAAAHTGETPEPSHASQKSTSAFLFSKDSWPDAKQILYQLIDIDIPEVVEMLAVPVSRQTCDSVYGWMPNDYQKTIRALMTRYLETWLKMSNQSAIGMIPPEFLNPMTTARPRRAFIAYKEGLDYTFNYSDPVDVDSNSVVCEYTAAAINSRPECISVQHFHHSGVAQTLAYGSSRAICLANTVNNDIRVFKTIFGHHDIVSCVRWVDSFKGPNITKFESCLVSGSEDGDVKLWNIGGNQEKELISLKVPSAVISVHAVYTDESESQIVLAAACKEQITVWTLGLSLADEKATSAEASNEIKITYTSHTCLTLRLWCLTPNLLVLFSGMSSGHTEVRTVIMGESSAPIAGSLQGHCDWINCLDCIQMYPPTEPIVEGQQILVATGSKDTQIRIWHLRFLEGSGEGLKGQRLHLPVSYSSSHILLSRLESVIKGHNHSVTGLAWSPVLWSPKSCPQLLSASADKTLIIWAPSEPLFSNDGEANLVSESAWLEQVSVGTVGGKSLGFLGCAWGNYNNEIYGHGFRGDLSTWSTDGEPRITLTGHFNSVTDLSWCRETIDGTPIKSIAGSGDDDSFISAYPPYLLTCGLDSTVRLHGLFYTEGSGCSPPVRMWRELARPQLHGYEMNSVVSMDFIHYISAGDEKVGRVFSATESFVEQFLSEATIQAHPGLQHLPIAAVQPEQGLSNRPMIEAEEQELIETNSEYIKSPYPPTESALTETTLWLETNKLYGHSNEVYSLALNPQGTLLASACKAAKEELAQILLWRTDNWQIHQTLRFHRLTVSQMRFNAAGDKLVSVSRDRMWALWKADIGSGDEKHQNFQLYRHAGKNTHSRIIWACAWSPDNKAFFTASRDKQIMAWHSESGERIGLPWSLSEPITAFDVGSTISGHATAFLAAAGFENGGIELLTISLAKLTCTSLFKLPPDWSHMGLSVNCLAFHPVSNEESVLASGGEDGMVRIFKINPSSLMK